MGADEEVDQAVILGDVVCLKLLLIGKGKTNGKIKKELNALKHNDACHGIEQTITTKGKNNKAAMIFSVCQTAM